VQVLRWQTEAASLQSQFLHSWSLLQFNGQNPSIFISICEVTISELIPPSTGFMHISAHKRYIKLRIMFYLYMFIKRKRQCFKLKSRYISNLKKWLVKQPTI
jgi:hypothetical protein